MGPKRPNNNLPLPFCFFCCIFFVFFFCLGGGFWVLGDNPPIKTNQQYEKSKKKTQILVFSVSCLWRSGCGKREEKSKRARIEARKRKKKNPKIRQSVSYFLVLYFPSLFLFSICFFQILLCSFEFPKDST